MKKFLTSILLAITMLFATVLPAFAVEPEIVPQPIGIQESDDGITTVYYEDGSILTISAVYNVIENESISRATSETTSGSRDAYFTDGNGDLEWKYTLSASFSYVPGVSSSCTSASYSNSTYDSSWSFSEGSATKSGSTAYGKGKYVKQILFVTVNTYNIDLSISCDVNGNLS